MTLKERIGKWLFPELFQERKVIIETARQVGLRLLEARLESTGWRTRALGAEDTLREMRNRMKSSLVSYDMKTGTTLSFAL